MSKFIEVRVPDIGTSDDVDVVEVLVAVGDRIEPEDSLITLESDKASMEVPSPQGGTVHELLVTAGDKISQDGLILRLAASSDAAADDTSADNTAADGTASRLSTTSIPDATKTAASSDPTDEALEDEPPAVATSDLDRPSKPAASSSPSDGDADIQTELMVLGSGPGGYTAAFRAADLGKKVVLVERYPKLGGVCLNVGCIPSKALLHLAKVIDEAETSASHGVSFGEPQIDLAGVRSFKDGVVGKLTGGLTSLVKQRKVQVVVGQGTFVSGHRLQVETTNGTQTIDFEHAIIAAGSRVTKIPGIPYGDTRVMDSTDALELAEIPPRLLVIGGGIIGLEMATVYHALGSKVTIVELLDGLIPGADRDIVRPLQRRISKQYENIFLGTKVSRVESRDEGLEAFFEGPKAPSSAIFDRVLVAVGRRPNGDQIAAQTTGVEVDGRGFIPVDGQMRTGVDHIFAIGDIVGQPMLAHKAVHEGRVAAEVIAGEKSAFDARVIPSVAYTDPEVAWVGLTEEQARAQNLDYGKGVFPWSASGRSLALGRSEGMTKILFDNSTHRVIGGAMVGPQAGDLIAEVGLAIEMGCDAQDLGLTIHPHPTLSETVGMSAEAFEGTLTDLYLPKTKR